MRSSLTESSGNPLAKSEADCRGLMQVSEEVWNIFMKGKRWNLAYNPEENVRCGIRYLGDLYKMYVSWEKVLRHYHSGDPNSKRTVTNRYVKKVLKRAGMMSGDRRWFNRKELLTIEIVDIEKLRKINMADEFIGCLMEHVL